jgi:hypothetical protein
MTQNAEKRREYFPKKLRAADILTIELIQTLRHDMPHE